MSFTIHMAAAQGDTAAIKAVLVGFPEMLDAPGPDGLSPLRCALRNNQRSAVECLLEAGARIRASEIVEAARSGSADYLKMLIEHGGDVNAQNVHGLTPLQTETARKDDLLSVSVRLLLEHGASPELKTRYDSPLLLAAKNPRTDNETLEALLEHGADPNTRDRQGRTPMYYASLHGRAGVVDLLIQYGGKVDPLRRHTPQVSPEEHDRRLSTLIIIGVIICTAVFVLTYFR